MSALVTLARGMARRQLLGLIAVGVLGGLGMGVASTAASGARRADTAYARLREASLSPDALFDATTLSDHDVERLAALPGVSGIARFSYTPVAPDPLVPGVSGGGFVGLDDDFLVNVYRPLVVRGRLAARGAPDEVVVNEAMARDGHLRVGQRVQLISGFDGPASLGSATVVGVVRGIFDVGANARLASVLLSASFLEAHRDGVQLGPQPAALLRLSGGEADLPAFGRAASEALGRDLGIQFTGSGEAVAVNRTLRVQTVGLATLALAAGVATLAAVVQALQRVLQRALRDLPILISIGVQPRQRVILGGLLVGPVVAAGGLVAAATTVLASPLIPTGLARQIDPLRGLHLDLPVLVGVLVVWALVLGPAGAVLAWRVSRPHRTTTAGRVRRLVTSLPFRARMGCEAALTPLHSAGGAASGAAVVAAVVAVAGVVTVFTFGASLTHLLTTPALQGWSFDAAVSSEDGIDSLRTSLAALADDPAVRQVGWATPVDVEIEGVQIEAYAFDPQGDRVHPTMRSGRAPSTDGEIALGADLLRGGHLSLGDPVTVSGPRGKASLVIVGTATYPEMGHNGDLGTGASITRGVAERLGAPEHGSLALVRMRPGQTPAVLKAYASVGEIVTPFRPSRVRNLEQVGALPWVLGAFASMLGVLAVGHGLWSSIRGRRRDLGVLVSLGFRPRDIRALLLWQVGCVAAIGVIVGGSVGIIAGTAAWSTVATATAVVERTWVPTASLVLVSLGAFLACALVGLTGGRWIGAERVAAALRGE